MSDTYARKKKIREANKQDREFRDQAKRWFRETFGDLDKEKYRDRITKIKKILENGGQPIVVDYHLVKVDVVKTTY